MPATAEATTSTILRSELRSDGTMKFRLAKREQRLLENSSELLRTLMRIPALSEKAEAAVVKLVELIEELT